MINKVCLCVCFFFVFFCFLFFYCVSDCKNNHREVRMLIVCMHVMRWKQVDLKSCLHYKLLKHVLLLIDFSSTVCRMAGLATTKPSYSCKYRSVALTYTLVQRCNHLR
jgi:hypothetical protein